MSTSPPSVSAEHSVETPQLSLVIPAYNEAAMLPRLLSSIAIAKMSSRSCLHLEVIVADNASTDETAQLAAAAGARVVPVERRCIASARNGGAAAAGGDLLAFVDADSLVHAVKTRLMHAWRKLRAMLEGEDHEQV